MYLMKPTTECLVKCWLTWQQKKNVTHQALENVYFWTQTTKHDSWLKGRLSCLTVWARGFQTPPPPTLFLFFIFHWGFNARFNTKWRELFGLQRVYLPGQRYQKVGRVCVRSSQFLLPHPGQHAALWAASRSPAPVDEWCCGGNCGIVPYPFVIYSRTPINATLLNDI